MVTARSPTQAYILLEPIPSNDLLICTIALLFKSIASALIKETSFHPKVVHSERGNPVPLLNLAELRRAYSLKATRRGLMKETGLCAETEETGESMR